MERTFTQDATVDLGRCGEAVLHLAADRKHLQIELDVPFDGLDKSSLNGLIAALTDVREAMYR